MTATAWPPETTKRTRWEIRSDIRPITTRAERARTIEQFRNGSANALVSAQVLDEGLDVPKAEIAIVVGGSGNMRRHVQRIGRVLQPAPGKRARVYELRWREASKSIK